MGRAMKILISPLDWGLGHATRCIPLIQAALLEGHEVHIAGEPKPLSLLKREFPELTYVPLTGVQVHYSQFLPMALSMLLQVPKLIWAVIREYKHIQKLQESQQYDVILSDNRFGVKSPKSFNIYMTHQVTIALPGFLRRFEFLTQKFHQLFYKNAQILWIPDFPPGHDLQLAESLSEPQFSPHDHLGYLSRFQQNKGNSEKIYDCMISLSGPEPSRSILEHNIIKALTHSQLKVVILRGQPEGSETALDIPGCDVEAYPHLGTKEFQSKLELSHLVISRSGYSSLMDYQALGAQALIIPTPGQTEQERLARDLSSKGVFYTCQEALLDQETIFKALKWAQANDKSPASTSLDQLRESWKKIECQI